MLAFIISAVLLIASCSVFQSGSYVQLKSMDSLDSLAKTYGIQKHEILVSNQDKLFHVGEWIFIPEKAGIMGANNDSLGSANNPEAYITSGEMLWPVPSCKTISSKFGKRWGRRHHGIDIPGREGSHILAADSGVVVYSGSEFGGYGNIVVLAHDKGLFTVYAHTKKYFVQKGQKVHRGQVIAQVGKSGRSTGAHLHFEVRKNSKAYNPTLFVSAK